VQAVILPPDIQRTDYFLDTFLLIMMLKANKNNKKKKKKEKKKKRERRVEGNVP
jgi:hypothetical protein